jgi:hypothetical protein
MDEVGRPPPQEPAETTSIADAVTKMDPDANAGLFVGSKAGGTKPPSAALSYGTVTLANMKLSTNRNEIGSARFLGST